MLAKRIIPCLDVKDGKVIKGTQFRNHRIVGDILERAAFYSENGADELVFYDITASSEQRAVDKTWIQDIAKSINIPFCVAGGIRTLQQAETILHAGADKISLNSPALEQPELINQMVQAFGQQCIVIGIDSFTEKNQYTVYQYTGNAERTIKTKRVTQEWLREVQDRGAGEIVLNCMNQDGVRKGYDIKQLKQMREDCRVPLIASGGAGSMQDFVTVFRESQVDGALAASVFHNGDINIADLKQFLNKNTIEVRL